MFISNLAFPQPEIYQSYRTYYLAEDQSRLSAGFVLWSIIYLIFIIIDFRVFGFSQPFFVILFLRLLYIAFGMVCLFFLAKRVRNWQNFDRLAFTWGLVSVLFTILLHLFHKPAREYGFVFDLVGCLSFYLFITNRLEMQLIPAVLYTSFDIFLVVFFREQLQPSMFNAVLVAFLGINLIGVFHSIQFFKARRKAFQAYRDGSGIQAELQRLASTDSLTGVYNRRRLLELASESFYRFRRYGRPFSILIMDLDGFKRINDTFGHQQGDATLIEFSHILLDEKRVSDVLGRMGGDEFCLILPETTTQAAISLAERILPRCQGIDVGASGALLIEITVSIGISQAQLVDENIDSLFARADAALYQAKNNGRNCWQVL